MRKQIAAANWKMNLSFEEGQTLLDTIIGAGDPPSGGEVIFAVPFPYLVMAVEKTRNRNGFAVAAQNCSDKESGAFTGEVSAAMLKSIGVTHCILGHSERREYFGETAEVLAQKLDRCLSHSITPIFCCGEPLQIREENRQNEFVEQQLEASLAHLSPEQLSGIIIAYEPIWAIGTGKTATTGQAQEMHAHLRSVLSRRFGAAADAVPILYGGSVKGGNAAELFANADVDGGLVGGASLVATEFVTIIKALYDQSGS